MDDGNRKNEIVKTMTDVEYYPAILEKEEVSVDSYTKLPLDKIATLGTAFEPLTAAFQHIFLGKGGTTSGLYRVTIPNGSELVRSRKSPGGYLGAISRGNNQVGGGQAILNPLVCNPTMLFVAAALASINKKLDSIQEAQKEIIEFLEQKEKSKLRANLNFLTDVLNNYKYNWNNEIYKNSNHVKVLDIKQHSEQSILVYREQIENNAKKKSFLHSDKDVKDKLEKLQSAFKEYQLALYLYAFSSFLDVMLLENFKSAYLDGIAHKIEDYALRYRELYTECYSRIEGYSKFSIQSHLLSELASINRAAGETVAKIPVISDSQIDETLIETSSRLGKFRSRRTEQTMGQLVNHQSSSVHPFIENINAVNRLYNQPLELLFDEENIYFGLIEGE